MQACLILKPQLVERGYIGKILDLAELAGSRVEDLFALRLTTEDLYNFYEMQVKFPTEQEIKTYLGGISVVVGLDLWVNPTPLFKFNPIYFSHTAAQGEIDCRFWFGSQ